MEKLYVKQCPYCNSIRNHLIFSTEHSRMVSKCEDCDYSGSVIFKDVEKSLAKTQTVRINDK